MQSWQKTGHFVPLIVIALGGFLRFWLLTNQSLWWDEGFSLINSSGSSFAENLSIVRNIRNADKFQPLYYWLLFFARQIFGNSEAVLRGFSALLGVLILPVIYITASRFYSQKHALWSLLLVTFSAFLIYYSQEVRNYSLLILLAALQLYFLNGIVTEKGQGQSGQKWGLAFFVGLGLFGSIQLAVFSAGLSASHLLTSRQGKEWLALWFPAMILSLPALIYYATLPGETDPTAVSISRASTPIVVNLAFAVYGILVGTTYGPPQDSLRGNDKLATIVDYAPHLLLIIFICLVILCFLWRIFGSSYRDTNFYRANLFFAHLFICSLLFGILLTLATGMNLVPRHIFYLWVQIPFLLPSTFCWPRLALKRTIKLHNLARFFFILLICLNIYSLHNYYFKNIHWRDDYRSVAEYLIDSQSSRSSKTILLSGEPSILVYYGDSETAYLGGKWISKALSGDSTWIEGFNLAVGGSENITVAIYRPQRFVKTNFTNDFAGSYLILGKVNRFDGFEILHLKAI